MTPAEKAHLIASIGPQDIADFLDAHTGRQFRQAVKVIAACRAAAIDDLRAGCSFADAWAETEEAAWQIVADIETRISEGARLRHRLQQRGLSAA